MNSNQDQGGPGSTSMIGLFTENGPFKVVDGGMLERNPNSWNKHYSMVFIDQPVGTGFSYVGNKTSKQVGRPNISSLLDEHLLTAKYAASKCSKDPFNPLDLKPEWIDGYCSNQAAVGHDVIVFLDRFYQEFPELLKSDLYLTGESYAGKYIPAIAHQIHTMNIRRPEKVIPLAGLGIGNGFTDPISQIQSHAPQALALGLIDKKAAGKMDLFAKVAVSAICDGDYKLALSARQSLFDVFSNASGGINMYDVRKANSAYNRSVMISFLKDEKTKSAINVGLDAIFGKDWNMFPPLELDIMKSSAEYFVPLLDAGYKVLLYQGQFDFRDGVLSQTQWIERIGWKGQDGYLNATRNPWFSDSTLIGYSTEHANLARVEMLNCGHLCPMDISFTGEMIEKFLIRS